MGKTGFTGLFAVCALSAAVRAVAGEDAAGVRMLCGLAVALSMVRLTAELI